MKPVLTWRRALFALLLLTGSLLLALGAYSGGASISILGLACWLAAAIGTGTLLVQRLNAVTRLMRTNCADVQELRARADSSAKLLKKEASRTDRALEQLSMLREAYEAQGRTTLAETARIGSRIESLDSRLAAWSNDLTTIVTSFRSQFGEFVGAIGEWLAIADVEARRNTESMNEFQRSTRKETLNALGALEQATRKLADEAAAHGAQVREVETRLKELLKEVQAVNKQQPLEQVADRLGALDRALSDALHEMGSVARRIDAEGKHLARVSTKVDGIVPAHRTQISRSRLESTREIEAILQLQALLPLDKPLPLLGDWALDPIAMLAIVGEIMRRQPNLVLECGSGTSTLWIAKALKRVRHGRLISLEHVDDHRNNIRHLLREHGLADVAEVLFAPLRSYQIGEEALPWYDLSGLDVGRRSVEFLLIDGPQGSVGRMARYPALPLLEELLADEAIVVLDDSDRPDEREAIDRWLQKLPRLRPAKQIGPRSLMFTLECPPAPKKHAEVHPFPIAVEQAQT